MSYRELFRKVSGKVSNGQVNKRKEMIADSPVFIVIFRRLSYLLTPLFVILNISANGVTYMRFVIILFAISIISFGNKAALATGIILLFFCEIIDCVDGNIARLNNKTSFYGRFVDSLIDIFQVSSLQLVFSYVAFTRFQNYALMWTGIICATIIPFHHFIFDKYSAYIRWINKEKNLAIEPYIRKKINLRFMNLLRDAQYLTLILSIHFFSAALWTYFLINIFIAVVYVYSHIKASYKFMQVDTSGN